VTVAVTRAGAEGALGPLLNVDFGIPNIQYTAFNILAHNIYMNRNMDFFETNVCNSMFQCIRIPDGIRMAA